MSATDDSIELARAQVSTDRRNSLSMIRRMAVSLTSKTFWQAAGVLLLDSQTREAIAAEVYSGIGFYSRPKSGSRAECMVGFAGGPENPAIIATRDEDLRKKVFPQGAPMGEDETAAFNTTAVMHIKAGKVLAYLVGHIASAVGLAKVSELNDLRSFVAAQFTGAGHVHSVSGLATTATTPVGLPPALDYPGTQVLKGE